LLIAKQVVCGFVYGNMPFFELRPCNMDFLPNFETPANPHGHWLSAVFASFHAARFFGSACRLKKCQSAQKQHVLANIFVAHSRLLFRFNDLGRVYRVLGNLAFFCANKKQVVCRKKLVNQGNSWLRRFDLSAWPAPDACDPPDPHPLICRPLS
jgi:hypothetical protein